MPPSADQNPRYLVVEGPIGVGKTTLAKRLAHSFESDPLLERVDDNPFLERFYSDPKSAALSTQLHFLFSRAELAQTLRQSDLFRPAFVADFMLEKDHLFAEVTLSDDEFVLYRKVYDSVNLHVPQPDLVVYLQAPLDVLLRRIAKRGRDWERRIDPNHLERLSNAYTRFFHDYNNAPLLIVNAAEIDLVNNDNNYQQLLHQVQTLRTGRHYFNPMPIAL